MNAIKQAAAAVNKKRDELAKAKAKLVDMREKAQLPRPAKTGVRKTVAIQNSSQGIIRNDPASPVRIIQEQNIIQGAQTYALEEYVEEPAEDDILTILQQQRKTEISRAHLERRSPDIADLDHDIAEIEIARSSIELLEKDVEILQDELKKTQQPLGMVCMSFAHDQWDAAYLEYEAALDAMIEALAKMRSTDSIAEWATNLAGRKHYGRTDRFLGEPHRKLKNGEFHPVNFNNSTRSEFHDEAVSNLRIKLEKLGVEL